MDNHMGHGHKGRQLRYVRQIPVKAGINTLEGYSGYNCNKGNNQSNAAEYINRHLSRKDLSLADIG